VLRSQTLYELLELFHRRIRFDDPLLVASVPDEMLFLASLADSFKMPVEDKFVFTCAPVDTRDTFMMHRYETWMKAFTEGKRARIDALDPHYERDGSTGDPDVFLQAELLVKMLTVYAWLSYRYPGAFPDLDECDRQRDVLNQYIERTLRRKGRVRKCQSCGEPMPAFYRHATCDDCFRGRRRRRRVG
jgi:ATP-dependent RNA helicase SUPV3L1/SUV3